MGTMHGSWIWYDLMTSDPEGAKTFYEAVVGWSMTTGDDQNDADYGFITARDGAMTGGVLRLKPELVKHGVRPGWVGYIAVDNVDTGVAAIEAAGGKILRPPFDIEMIGRVAMVSDFWGAPFYVMTPNPPPGGGQSTAFSAMPNPGHCGWNELMAGDAAAAIAFYTNQFGWTLPEPMDMGPMGKYQFIAHDEVAVGAIMPKPPQVPVSAWSHYFWVASIDAALAAVTAAGGTVVNGPHQVPGELWVIQGIDPQGAMFSLTGHK